MQYEPKSDPRREGYGKPLFLVAVLLSVGLSIFDEWVSLLHLGQLEAVIRVALATILILWGLRVAAKLWPEPTARFLAQLDEVVAPLRRS